MFACAVQPSQAHGDTFGLTHLGMYAGDSMRMEKGYGYWKADFNRYEAGLEPVVSSLCSFDPDNTLLRGVAT